MDVLLAKLRELDDAEAWEMALALDAGCIAAGQPAYFETHVNRWLEEIANSVPLSTAPSLTAEPASVPGLELIGGFDVGDPRSSFTVHANHAAIAGSANAIGPLMRIAENHDGTWSNSSRYDALNALARVWPAAKLDKDRKSELADRLLAIYHDLTTAKETVAAQEAAGALGNLDFDALFDLREEPFAREALCRFSSERGYVIYESFYVTPQGIIVDQRKGRDCVYIVMPFPAFSSAAELFYTHLTTWGFMFDFEDWAGSCGAIVYLAPGTTVSQLPAEALDRLGDALNQRPDWSAIVLHYESTDLPATLKELTARGISRVEPITLPLNSNSTEAFTPLRDRLMSWRSSAPAY